MRFDNELNQSGVTYFWDFGVHSDGRVQTGIFLLLNGYTVLAVSTSTNKMMMLSDGSVQVGILMLLKG